MKRASKEIAVFLGGASMNHSALRSRLTLVLRAAPNEAKYCSTGQDAYDTVKKRKMLKRKRQPDIFRSLYIRNMGAVILQSMHSTPCLNLKALPVS